MIEETQQQVEQVEVQKEDTGIVIHSIESDLAVLNENSVEESIDAVQHQKEEVKESKPEKLTRRERRNQRQANVNKAQAEENEKLRERVRELESKSSEQEAKEVLPEIDIDDFTSYEEYDEAKRERKALLAKQADELETKEEVKELPDVLQESKQNMLEDGVEDYEDFEELIYAKDLALTSNVLAVVLESDVPSDVAYYLATHKDETREIAKLSTRKMVKAILKIENKLENSPKSNVVQTTNAPEPIKPVSGQSVKGKSLNDNDLSYEQHEALLNSRTQDNAGGFI